MLSTLKITSIILYSLISQTSYYVDICSMIWIFLVSTKIVWSRRARFCWLLSRSDFFSEKFTLFERMRGAFYVFRRGKSIQGKFSIGDGIANENKQGRRLIAQDGSAVLVKRFHLKNVLLNGTWPGSPLRWHQRRHHRLETRQIYEGGRS